MPYYPMNLNIAGRLCVVVGGGEVAWRKIRSLLGCGGKVVVVSPQVVPGIQLLAERGELSWVERRYRQGDLDGAILAFAATDSREVQKLIGEEARSKGVMLNSADDPKGCDFHVPAKVRRGELLITVSTGGGSPAISKMVRRQLESSYGPEYGVAIALFAAIRTELVSATRSSDENRKVFHELLMSNILEHIQARDWKAAEEVLVRVLPSGTGVPRIVQEMMTSAEEMPAQKTG